MDERGYCRIEGRLKDMIIRGGENIYPREIEDVLFAHPTSPRSPSSAMPDDAGARSSPPSSGRRRRGVDAAELSAYCRERLAPYKVPRTWFFVDAFPLTGIGQDPEVQAAGAVTRRRLLTQLANCYSASMGFPDRIERTLDVAHPPQRVWAALTTAEGVGVLVRPGGHDRPPPRWVAEDELERRADRAHAGGTGGGADGVRVHLAHPRVARRRPAPHVRRVHARTGWDGHRVRMVETGFAQLPDDPTAQEFDAHTEGWIRELGELVAYLDAR